MLSLWKTLPKKAHFFIAHASRHVLFDILSHPAFTRFVKEAWLKELLYRVKKVILASLQRIAKCSLVKKL